MVSSIVPSRVDPTTTAHSDAGDFTNTLHLHFVHQFAVNSCSALLVVPPVRGGRMQRNGEAPMAARMVRSDRGRLRRGALSAAVAVVGLLISPGAGAADQLNVVLDQAQIVKLPERVSTIVLGNPSIAD